MSLSAAAAGASRNCARALARPSCCSGIAGAGEPAGPCVRAVHHLPPGSADSVLGVRDRRRVLLQPRALHRLVRRGQPQCCTGRGQRAAAARPPRLDRRNRSRVAGARGAGSGAPTVSAHVAHAHIGACRAVHGSSRWPTTRWWAGACTLGSAARLSGRSWAPIARSAATSSSRTSC